MNTRGWVRLGVAASVVWGMATAYLAVDEFRRMPSGDGLYARALEKWCPADVLVMSMDELRAVADASASRAEQARACLGAKEFDWDAFAKKQHQRIAMRWTAYALVPILLLWVVGRWVVRGFQARPT